jgi:hypothetical protein
MSRALTAAGEPLQFVREPSKERYEPFSANPTSER